MSELLGTRTKILEDCESALFQLADCINQEIRENGPRTDQIFNVYTQDLRMFVKRLVDYCKADSKQRIEAAERQLSDLRAEVAGMKEDASRYKWILENPNDAAQIIDSWELDGMHDDEELNSAIDAARSGK